MHNLGQKNCHVAAVIIAQRIFPPICDAEVKKFRAQADRPGLYVLLPRSSSNFHLWGVVQGNSSPAVVVIQLLTAQCGHCDWLQSNGSLWRLKETSRNVTFGKVRDIFRVFAKSRYCEVHKKRTVFSGELPVLLCGHSLPTLHSRAQPYATRLEHSDRRA